MVLYLPNFSLVFLIHVFLYAGVYCTVRVKCLVLEHNTMSLARARTRPARSGDECTNHEANAFPTRKVGCLPVSKKNWKFWLAVSQMEQ